MLNRLLLANLELAFACANSGAERHLHFHTQVWTLDVPWNMLLAITYSASVLCLIIQTTIVSKSIAKEPLHVVDKSGHPHQDSKLTDHL